MKSNIVLITMAIAGIGLVSCQKFESSESNTNLTDTLSDNLLTAQSDIISIQTGHICTDDIQSVSLIKFGNGHGNDGILYDVPEMHMMFRMPHLSSCATISVNDSTYPQIIVIDYGEGCTNGRGHVKKGKILIEVTDTLVAAGSIKSIKTEDFYIDSMKVDLVATIENIGKNNSGNWVIACNYNQTITSQLGDVIKEIYSDTSVWTSGFETIEKDDDVFTKTGSGTKTINDTVKYSQIITSPLLFDRSCEYVKSGIIKIIKGADEIIIDYGDGTCDNTATVTTNGTTETIDLSTILSKHGGHFGNPNGGGPAHGHHGHGPGNGPGNCNVSNGS
jgi:hypothetical protein